MDKDKNRNMRKTTSKKHKYEYKNEFEKKDVLMRVKIWVMREVQLYI